MEPLNVIHAWGSDMWADLVGLFWAVRYWWLTEESGPALLLWVRIVSAVAYFGAGVSWSALSHAPIFERTWTAGEAARFRFLVRVVSVGAFAVAAYLIAAGILEAERTSSPHRLIVANAANALLSVPLAFLGYFLRLTYTRKAVDVARRAVEDSYRAQGA